jgi:hypothetical protein
VRVALVTDNTPPERATPVVFRPTCRTAPRCQIYRVTLVEALDQEWRELVRDHRIAVARWAERHCVLAPCRSLDDILSAAKLNSDPVLAALLAEVSRGDQLAARVVLQALMGRMVRMAQRDRRSSVQTI